MTAPTATPSIDVSHLSPESLTALRVSLVRELSVQTMQAEDCRATASVLTGDSLLGGHNCRTHPALVPAALSGRTKYYSWY